MNCNDDSITNAFNYSCEDSGTLWNKKKGGQTAEFLQEFKDWPRYISEPDYFLKGHVMFECIDGYFHCYPDKKHSVRWSAGYVQEMINKGIIKIK